MVCPGPMHNSTRVCAADQNGPSPHTLTARATQHRGIPRSGTSVTRRCGCTPARVTPSAYYDVYVSLAASLNRMHEGDKALTDVSVAAPIACGQTRRPSAFPPLKRVWMPPRPVSSLLQDWHQYRPHVSGQPSVQCTAAFACTPPVLSYTRTWDGLESPAHVRHAVT